MLTSRPHIVVEDLRIGWGSRVLMEHVNFEVERGTTLPILGGSGSGKSTLLRYLIGLEQPMSGRIDIDGVGEPHVYSGVPRFGVLFQSGALFSSLTLAENLALPLTTWTSVRGPLVQDLVHAKLDLVGLGPFAGHLPGEISGGMAIIEFQMSTAAFLGAQRNALLQRRICLPGPFAFSAVTGIGPINIVLDRVEFGANALVHSVKEDFDLLRRKYQGLPDELDSTPIHGFKTQMTQDVTVHVTTLEDILSHPNQSPATVVPVHGTLVFDISAYALIESGIFMACRDEADARMRGTQYRSRPRLSLGHSFWLSRVYSTKLQTKRSSHPSPS